MSSPPNRLHTSCFAVFCGAFSFSPALPHSFLSSQKGLRLDSPLRRKGRQKKIIHIFYLNLFVWGCVLKQVRSSFRGKNKSGIFWIIFRNVEVSCATKYFWKWNSVGKQTFSSNLRRILRKHEVILRRSRKCLRV